MAGRGQAHRVGPLGAGHEPERHLTGQTQKLHEPGPGDLLDHGGRRRGQVVVRRLVPACGEHVSRGRGIKGTPDDEAEIARTGRRDHGRLDRGGELVDHLARRGRAGRQPAPDRRPHGVQVDLREHRGLGGGLAVGRHAVRGPRSGRATRADRSSPNPGPRQAIPPTSSAPPDVNPAPDRHQGECMHRPANPRHTWSIWIATQNQISRPITRISLGMEHFSEACHARGT